MADQKPWELMMGYKDDDDIPDSLHHVAAEMLSQPRHWILWGLAFLMGWAGNPPALLPRLTTTALADVMTLIRYYGFSTMMTGNTAFAAASGEKGCWWPVLLISLTIFSFFSGVVAFRAIQFMITKCWKSGHLNMIGPGTAVGLMTLVSFVIADITYYSFDHGGDYDDKFACGR